MLGCGSPDYHQPIAVGPGSTLGEGYIDVRSHHGKAYRAFREMPAEAAAVTDLISIAGRGILYGGYAYADGALIGNRDYFYLKVDGQVLGYTSFLQMENHGMNTPYSNSVYALKYDNVAFDYTVGFMPGITFESLIEVKYGTFHGNEPTLIAQIIYALITEP